MSKKENKVDKIDQYDTYWEYAYSIKPKYAIDTLRNNVEHLRRKVNELCDAINDFEEVNKKIEHLENYVDFANLTEDSKFDYLYEMISKLIKHINK